MSFACHGFGAGAVRFGPDELPRAVLGGVLCLVAGWIVVLLDAAGEIVRGANVESALVVFENINLE